MAQLPRSVLEGAAVSGAFVTQNRQDQQYLAQQNAVVAARMDALVEQGQSILYAMQRQARMAQIQQGFAGLHSAVAGLDTNMQEIGSLSAALQPTLFVSITEPGIQRAAPSELDRAEPQAAATTLQSQTARNPILSLERRAALVPEVVQAVPTRAAVTTGSSAMQRTTDAAGQFASFLHSSPSFQRLENFITNPSFVQSFVRAEYQARELAYGVLEVLPYGPGPFTVVYKNLAERAAQRHGVDPVYGQNLIPYYCQEIRYELLNHDVPQNTRNGVLVELKAALLVFKQTPSLVTPLQDALQLEIEKIDLDLQRVEHQPALNIN